jgi:hypothetical protein
MKDNDNILAFRRGNVPVLGYRRFMTPDEQRALQLAQERGESGADVIPLKPDQPDKTERGDG